MLNRICFFASCFAGLFLLMTLGTARVLHAQEKPYFVTYSQDLEEPGNLEIEALNAVGQPMGGDLFGATALELEYGTRAWWTSEFYLDGQTTAGQSTLFTGFRVENRVRPWMSEHWINPLLYVEYENISGADKTLLEVVGHDGQSDVAVANAEASQEHQHEAELKLILSSNAGAWNISENFISEKNLGHAPWEFGYAVGATRPLSTRYQRCTFCANQFIAGVEAYGGLGNTDQLTLGNTSHYIAPLLGWNLPTRMRVSFSTGFGISGSSMDHIYRVGYAYEIPQIWTRLRNVRGAE